MTVKVSRATYDALCQRFGLPAAAPQRVVVAALEGLDARRSGSTTGFVAVPRQELHDLVAAHIRGREALLDAAAGKYAPENRAAWALEYDRRPVATTAHFEQAPVLFGSNLHTTHGDEANEGEDAFSSSAYRNWSSG